MGLLRLQIVDRWMTVDPNADPLADDTQAKAGPDAVFDAGLVDVPNAEQAARALQWAVGSSVPTSVVDLQFIPLFRKTNFLELSVEENAGISETLCLYFRLQFKIAEVVISHGSNIEQMAPLAFGYQAAVPDFPRCDVLRGTPTF